MEDFAGPQNVRVARPKRCRARFPALRPRPAGSLHGAVRGPALMSQRGPRKRGALGEGPARPPLRPALNCCILRASDSMFLFIDFVRYKLFYDYDYDYDPNPNPNLDI